MGALCLQLQPRRPWGGRLRRYHMVHQPQLRWMPWPCRAHLRLQGCPRPCPPWGPWLVMRTLLLLHLLQCCLGVPVPWHRLKEGLRLLLLVLQQQGMGGYPCPFRWQQPARVVVGWTVRCTARLH